MNYIRINILIWVSLLGLISCEKQVNWQSEGSADVKLVVEGILTNEFKTQQIKLSLTRAQFEDSIPKVAGAQIWVYNGQDSVTFVQHDSIPGLYLSAVPFAATIDKTYHLLIIYQQKQYTATTQMVPLLRFNRLSVELADTNGHFRISQIASAYQPDEQAMYEIEICSDSIFTSVDTSQKALLHYYTFNTIDIGQVFAPNKDKLTFTEPFTIVERKYSLTPDYADFIRGIASETQWQGGVFSEFPANLPSNINGGALGYFTACTIAKDSVIVN